MRENKIVIPFYVCEKCGIVATSIFTDKCRCGGEMKYNNILIATEEEEKEAKKRVVESERRWGEEKFYLI